MSPFSDGNANGLDVALQSIRIRKACFSLSPTLLHVAICSDANSSETFPSFGLGFKADLEYRVHLSPCGKISWQTSKKKIDCRPAIVVRNTLDIEGGVTSYEAHTIKTFLRWRGHFFIVGSIELVLSGVCSFELHLYIKGHADLLVTRRLGKRYTIYCSGVCVLDFHGSDPVREVRSFQTSALSLGIEHFVILTPVLLAQQTRDSNAVGDMIFDFYISYVVQSKEGTVRDCSQSVRLHLWPSFGVMGEIDEWMMPCKQGLLLRLRHVVEVLGHVGEEKLWCSMDLYFHWTGSGRGGHWEGIEIGKIWLS